MKTAELKNHLHKLIVETNDNEVLAKINAYFEQLRQKDTDWWELLSVYEQITVNKGIEQLDDNMGKPHSEVKERINDIFTKHE